jgi:hypothetical protein
MLAALGLDFIIRLGDEPVAFFQKSLLEVTKMGPVAEFWYFSPDFGS